MMDAADVLAVVRCVTEAGVTVWLDGGWGVDALLGAQTRPHDDLDLLVTVAEADTARASLRVLGYAMAIDERPTRFVLGDAMDRRIDFHPITLDSDGGGIQQLEDGGTFRYPPEGLTGMGQVAGETMRCLTPAVQLICHLAYEPDENDRHDVRLLCARFGLDLPELYRES